MWWGTGTWGRTIAACLAALACAGAVCVGAPVTALDEVRSLERMADIAEAEAEAGTWATPSLLHSDGHALKGLGLLEAAPLALALRARAAQQQQQHSERKGGLDLERQTRAPELPLPMYERKLSDTFFTIVADNTANFSKDKMALEEEAKTIPIGAMNWFSYWNRLPPITSLALAAEQFDAFAGKGRDTITPRVLQQAYKDVFKWHISLDEARNMLIPLMVDPKDRVEVNRCEFALGVLNRTVLDLDMLRNTDALYDRRNANWTLWDVRFESGNGYHSPMTDKVYERVFLGPLGLPKGHHRLTRCMFKMVYAWDRDALFRNILTDPKRHVEFVAPKGQEMEEFLHRAVFFHTDEELHHANWELTQLLTRICRACDFSNSGTMSKTEFGCVLRTIDSWRNFLPDLAELPGFPDDVKPALYLDAENIVLDSPDEERSRFEKFWTHLVGAKSMFMTHKQLSEYLVSAKQRTDTPVPDETVNRFKRQHQQARYFDSVMRRQNERMLKEEVYHAIFGLPRKVALLSLEELTKTLGMIMPVEDVGRATKCDRDCWTVLSPIMEAFTFLDSDSDGFLTVAELTQLPSTVMPRLRQTVGRVPKYPSLFGKEITILFNEAMKEFGSFELRKSEPHFRLAAFTSLFRQQEAPHTVTLESFIDPPLLKIKRVAAEDEERGEEPAEEQQDDDH